MSREFRYVDRNYFYRALEDAASPEPKGRHEITHALTAIYAILAPIEAACAGYEASDNSSDYPTLVLQEEWGKLQDALATLNAIHQKDQALIAALLRNFQEKKDD